mmetsp:Transcript_13476/g.46899  ORF Transcript_13476/g.46899 Transcript_13476/m.46899 type:complete len:346 (-) Transcript_13476:79-1116(-)
MLHSAGPGSMHDNNEKEMWYEERVSENPSNVENLIKFAHFLQGIGKYDRAAKMYSTALQFDSEEARRQSYEITNSKNASIEIRSWEKTEIANLLEYNTLSQEWSARKVLLRWESSKPYSVGGQRECKRLKLSQLDALNLVESEQLSKQFTTGLTSGGGECEEHVRDYFREVLQQHVAQMFADEFNLQLGQEGAKQEVNFLPVKVLKLKDGMASNVEAFLEGDYRKHNDNFGHVLTTDIIPPALSHFSWKISSGRLMLCDIQGVDCTYTDAQIHSNLTSMNFGRGDYGEVGMKKFFENHECNEICKMLKLDQGERFSHPSFFSSGEGLQAAFERIVLRGVDLFVKF